MLTTSSHPTKKIKTPTLSLSKHFQKYTVFEKVDGATPKKRWIKVRGHDKSNTWELRHRHLLSRWYIISECQTFPPPPPSWNHPFLQPKNRLPKSPNQVDRSKPLYENHVSWPADNSEFTPKKRSLKHQK